MARVAAADGVTTIVATPHIRDDHPFDPSEVPERVSELNAALRRVDVSVDVLSAGEVAISKAIELSDDQLRPLCLGPGGHLLVESPYTHATDMFEQDLFNLQVRGFHVVLAHPERSPSFIDSPERLRPLVDRGVMSSLTGASLEGRFGRTVQRTALTMLRGDLAHNLASDAHDPRRRAPVLRAAAEAAEAARPGYGRWLTSDAPRAILAGAELPPRPPLARRRSRLWRRR